MSCGGNCKCNQSKGTKLKLNVPPGTPVKMKGSTLIIFGYCTVPNVFKLDEGSYKVNHEGLLEPIAE